MTLTGVTFEYLFFFLCLMAEGWPIYSSWLLVEDRKFQQLLQLNFEITEQADS